MKLSAFGWLGFVLFLAVYFYVKYAAAAPPQFDPGYARSVGILIGLTAFPPFLICLAAGRAFGANPAARLVALALLGSAICVGGYVVFFQMFIAGAAPGAQLIDVAKRGIGWGALQGALAFLATYKGR